MLNFKQRLFLLKTLACLLTAYLLSSSSLAFVSLGSSPDLLLGETIETVRLDFSVVLGRRSTRVNIRHSLLL